MGIGRQNRTNGVMLELVDALPPAQGEIIVLWFQNNLSYKRIGTITGLSVDEVGGLMHAGLAALRQMYEQSQKEKRVRGDAR